MDNKPYENKVYMMFSRKVNEHTENSEVKVSIDIFHELFRLSLTFVAGHIIFDLTIKDIIHGKSHSFWSIYRHPSFNPL